MVAAAVENFQDIANRTGAPITFSSASGETTIYPEVDEPKASTSAPDPMFDRALKYMADAEKALKNVNAGKVGPGKMFCCQAAQKQAISAAKKNLKQWSDFLATRALLTSYQAEMFDDDIEGDEDEVDEAGAERDGWL